MSSQKFFLPESALYRKNFGDKELDLLNKLIYHPIYGLLYKHRFRMAFSLIPETEKCLEIGCGYGQFLFSLASKTKKLYAADIHPYLDNVKEILKNQNVNIYDLRHASILDLPYPENNFNAVVCLSVLEHMQSLEKPVRELYRVLDKNGTLIVGFPVKNRLTQALFKLIDRDDSHIHPQSHNSILNELEKYFIIEKKVIFPKYFNPDIGLYFTGKLIKKT